MKLDNEYIVAVRSYFLAEKEEQKANIQKGITHELLLNLLFNLKSFFNTRNSSDSGLAAIAKRFDVEDDLEILKQIQEDYYGFLAGLYNAGESNTDIDTLIKSGNEMFLEEIEFQKNVEDAFRLNEYEILKEKFKEWDNSLDTASYGLETNSAITQSAERKIVDQDTFIKLMESIVYDFLPKESIVFNIAGKDLVHELFEGRSIGNKKQVGELNFGETPKNIIYFVAILVSGYELINRQKGQFLTIESASASQQWIDMMVQKGIDKELASKIAKKYIYKLI